MPSNFIHRLFLPCTISFKYVSFCEKKNQQWIIAKNLLTKHFPPFFFLFCCSLTAEVKPEDAKKDVPLSNLTDGKDKPFCESQKSDTTNMCCAAENLHDDVASQNSMDFVSALDESPLTGSGNNASQTQCSNGQKSKRPSSPGPHPVKTTCVAAQSPNPKLTLCLRSPKKVAGTPSDVEMLSPDSPVCKPMLISSSADKDYDVDASVETQVMKSQQTVRDSDSGSLDKEPVLPVAMGTHDAEKAECSGSSDKSLELIESKLGSSLQRYLLTFSPPSYHILYFIIS